MENSVVMDGRDIGTTVLTEAKFKFYITASPERRAERRYQELKSKGIEVTYSIILENIKKRDFDDMNREVSPLRKASDAIEVDTSDMTIEEVVTTLSSYIERKAC